MEIILVFAFITGRTLVLPDEYPMYLLGAKGEGGGHKRGMSSCIKDRASRGMRGLRYIMAFIVLCYSLLPCVHPHMG